MSKNGGGAKARKRERSGGQTLRRVEKGDEKKAQWEKQSWAWQETAAGTRQGETERLERQSA